MGRRRSAAAGWGAAAALAVALLAGCGGSSTDTATKASSTTAPVGGEATATTAPGYSGRGSARFCALLSTYSARLQDLGAKLGDPSQLKPYLQELSSDIKQAESAAPAEIKADVQLLAGVYNDFLAAVDKAGYDFTKVPAAAREKLQSAEVQAATARLSAYGTTVCGAKS
jgi:hypothetical protein